MSVTLTVVIPTLNEEVDLPKCLESLKNLADEIIVIDSGSTDRTLDIAKKYQAKIIPHDFKSFSDTRNLGTKKAKGDWVLSLEADVVVPSQLAIEIKNAIQDPSFDAFYIERLNHIWGKDILHTDWGPRDDCHIWLYKKGSGHWSNAVHEEYLTSGRIGKLNNRLIHHNYDTLSEFIDKTNRYSEIACQKGLGSNPVIALGDFFKRYFYKKGFLDGYHGLFLSYLQSTYFLSLWIKNQTR